MASNVRPKNRVQHLLSEMQRRRLTQDEFSEMAASMAIDESLEELNRQLGEPSLAGAVADGFRSWKRQKQQKLN